VSISVDVQYAVRGQDIPEEKNIKHWAMTCLQDIRTDAELTIRIVGEEEGAVLNRTWRKIDHATNVLSFPAGMNEIVPELLGDVIICAPVVNREAAAQGKSTDAHWAHMTIHGILHLLGYDHENDEDARIMESLETEKLDKLHYPDPYK